MMKRVRSLLLCLMMVFLAVAGDISTVQAVPLYENEETYSTLEKTALVQDFVKLSVLDKSTVAASATVDGVSMSGTKTTYTSKGQTSTSNMEIGETVYLGLEVDKSKMSTQTVKINATDTPMAFIQSIRAKLVFWEESEDGTTAEQKAAAVKAASATTAKWAKVPYDTYFEPIESGDVMVYDTEVPLDQITDASKYRFSRGWDQDSSMMRLTVNDPYTVSGTTTTAKAENIPDKVVLVIELKVKRAVDRFCKFGLEDVMVMGDNQVALSTHEDSWYHTDGNENSCVLENTQYNKRKTVLYSESADDSGDISVASGKEIKVPVYIGDNDGFNTLKLKTTVDDAAVLKYKSVKLSPEAKLYADLNVTSISSSRKEINISITSTKDIKLNNKTKLLEYVFEVYGDGLVKTEIVSISNESNTLMEGKAVYQQTPTGSISDTTVTGNNKTLARQIKKKDGLVRGDVNEDGNSTLVDAAILLQYYNGVRTLTDFQIELGDVNNSGTITLVDVLMIMQYYNTGTKPAGWVELP